MRYVEGYAPVYGGRIPATIWRRFMSGALEHIPAESLATPSTEQPSSTSTQPSYGR